LTEQQDKSPETAAALKVAICIATKGRAPILRETLNELRHQTRAPDRILICYADLADVAGICPEPNVTLLKGPPGLTVQRNVLLDATEDCDIVVFFDDDFLPAPRYLEVTIDVLAANPDIVATTGHVIADGAKGPGIPCEVGRQLLAADDKCVPGEVLSSAFHAYGCNMAARVAPARDHAVRFDERLALYAWYEDIDFSRRLARYGRIVRIDAARGVHLGTKSGRTSGKRLGYSQVMNCIYLARKGSYPWKAAIRSIVRHLAINLVRSPWPEDWVDRRGRLFGNTLAFCDLFRGRIMPERVRDL
jgi:GT2 family glycosyltransferase